MKTKRFSANLLKKGSLLALTTLIFAACSKDKSTPQPDIQIGKIALLISSPGAPELTFRINGQAAKTEKPLTYNTVIGYGNIKAAATEFSFTKKDGTEVLAKITGTIKPSSGYTLMVGDKSPKTALVLVEDDFSAPAAEKAKVRFANLSPDAAVLDLYVGGKTDAGLSKKAFKDVSGFINVDPGAELKLEIKENGKTDVLATLDKVKVEKGKIYTIWANGIKGASDATKLGISVMTNK